jgi:S-adenosylmethionine decarboxylase
MDELIYNRKLWVSETEPEKLRLQLGQFLEDCGYKILGFMEHYFEPEGYTALWLLAESHLALHTFPEKKAAYIELSGCNYNKNEHFYQLLINWCTTTHCI